MSEIRKQLETSLATLIQGRKQLGQQMMQAQQKLIEVKEQIDKMDGGIHLARMVLSGEISNIPSPAVPPDDGLPVIDIDDLEILGAGHGSA